MPLDPRLENDLAVAEEIAEPSMSASDISPEQPSLIHERAREVIWGDLYTALVAS